MWFRKAEKSTIKRKKVHKTGKLSEILDYILNIRNSYRLTMELVNYQELKKEAYLKAIDLLEEEYFNDKEILKKLENYRIKHLNGEVVPQ